MFPHISKPVHVPSSIMNRKYKSLSMRCKCINETPFSNGNSVRPLMVSNFFDPAGPLSFERGHVKFDFEPPKECSSSSVPFSIRFVQLRKKHANLSLPKTLPPNLCSLEASVLSLASIIEETQKLFFATDSSSSSDSDSDSCNDTGYSIVWLFRKVFISSPALTVSILCLMGEFVNASLKSEIKWALVDLEWQKIAESRSQLKEEVAMVEEELEDDKKFKSWSEIGILMPEEESKRYDETVMTSTKRSAYERWIICNENSSLILANYAELLYQQKDYDRAEKYFVRAVEAEPVDAEAACRYALFLWQHKGELEKAEEMFVKANDIDPLNNHYLCHYSRFLWTTGDPDICIE